MSKETKFKSVEGWHTKHRPKRFADIVGQPTAVSILKGMLASKELPNAIMFYGPSGNGKTTLATVLGRYINCATLNSCGKCASCKAYDADNHPDTHFINASADTGVDNVRGIIRQALYAPQHNVRIFFVDEVQGLSKAALEALLVPVEKPPGATLYIFCTTDPQKLTNTFIGRVTAIEVRKTGKDDMVTRLKQVAEAEKLTFPEEVYAACAESEGVRFALGLLQQAAFVKRANPKAPLASLLKAIGSYIDPDSVKTAQRLLLGMYAGKNSVIVSACYEAKDTFAVINQCLFNNQFVIGNLVGAKSGLIWAPANKEFLTLAKNKLGDNLTLERALAAQRRLSKMRADLTSLPGNALHHMLSTLTFQR